MNNFVNPFVKPTDDYVRDIDILRHYAQDQALYLQLTTGKPLVDCQRFVAKTLAPGGKFEFKDPKVVYLQRGDNGDRVKTEGTLNGYLKDALSKNELIAPTLTTYLHPDVKQSLLSLYIEGNIKARAAAKKQQFIAKNAGDKVLANIKKIEQTGRKLGNNAVSGAHVSPSTPLYNKTAHSTLTSVCRSTSGFGNANNEKFITGNRHYYTHHIVLNNIISIVRNTDYDKLRAVMVKYRIHVPSVEETVECIAYSTQQYWREAHYFKKIIDLVSSLKDMQRAAFVYTGDLYHLKKFNDGLVREFLTKLAQKVTGTHDNPGAVIGTAPDDHVNLAHLLCKKETQGIGKDYSKIEGTPAHATLALTLQHVAQILDEYRDMIGVLWVTTNLPASMAYFPQSIRRCAITSDTDSTIFTVQHWSIWYHGKITFDPDVPQIADVMAFLASATITNVLAVMSANFGIMKKDLYAIAMKNEFKFDVFIPTQLGKHYFADIACQEGNVNREDDHETEIKGVYLKSSNAPRPIIAQATAMMKDIMRCVREEGTLSVKKYLKEVADTERSIILSIKKGEYTYLRSGSIKDPASYTADPEDSPYMHHEFWNDVFGDKYGVVPTPPYATVKISVDLDTPQKMQTWVKGIKDRDFAARVERWMDKTGRKKLTTLNLPSQRIQSRGLPEEIFNVINYQKIVGDIMKIFYLILETLGVYSNGDKVRRMISTYY